MSRGGRYQHPVYRDTRTSLCFAGAPRSGDATGECFRPPTRVVLFSDGVTEAAA